jgi:hypothetical protein
VSLRREIIGWVIRRLAEIDAADEAQRKALFAALRREIEAEGFGGAAPDDALPQFESAAALQEAYWRREASAQASPAAQRPEPPKASSTNTKPWQGPKRLSLPAKPPGQAPGESTGPFADHVYKSVTLTVPGGTCELRLDWNYDPA